MFAEQIPDLLTFPQKPLPPITGEKIRGMASNDFDKDMKMDFVAGTDKGKIILYKIAVSSIQTIIRPRMLISHRY